jgi:PHD/YefM family antitoxin component YafN of YafNO toxin-antitoxin module
MLNLNTIRSITDLRINPGAIADLARDEGPVIIFDRSRPAGVFISPLQYTQMQEIIEDYYDSQKMTKAEKAPKKTQDWIPHDQLMKKLGLN